MKEINLKPLFFFSLTENVEKVFFSLSTRQEPAKRNYTRKGNLEKIEEGSVDEIEKRKFGRKSKFFAN